MKRRSSLTSRIVWITLLTTLIPSVTLVAASLYLGRQVTRDIDRQALQALDLAMTIQQTIMANRSNQLSAFGNDLALDPLLTQLLSEAAPAEAEAAVGRAMATAAKTADIILVADKTGAVRYRYGAAAGGQLPLPDLFTAAAAKGAALTGTERIPVAGLNLERPEVQRQVQIQVVQTQGATHPLAGQTLQDALAIAQMTPVRDQCQQVVGWVFLADILNNDFTIVDEVQSVSPEAMSITATMALDGVRVTTNVRKKDSDERAIGTIFADEITSRLRQGEPFRGRALVAGWQWQKALYEPIRNHAGQVIGSTYVGVPESLFDAVQAMFDRTTRVGLVVGLVAPPQRANERWLSPWMA